MRKPKKGEKWTARHGTYTCVVDTPDDFGFLVWKPDKIGKQRYIVMGYEGLTPPDLFGLRKGKK